ncbi:RNase P/MRP, p29 subunit [Abortiporus biennis]|nr:RNase P/MRP, p29 subunit [Abortiporus biennis]
MFRFRSRELSSADIYSDLPSISGQRVKIDNTTPFTPTYVKQCITQGPNPNQLYSNRVQSRQILLENPPRESKAKLQRDAKRAKRLSQKARANAGVISKRSAGEKGIWKLSPAEAKFNNFLPLHRLWLQYMSELLSLPSQPAVPNPNPRLEAAWTSGTIQAKLLKADFHGSFITVCKSKNPCLVGLSGIVIHETENAFKVVTKKNQYKLLPKPNSAFSLPIPLYATEFNGANPTDGGDSTAPNADAETKTILDMPRVEFELYGNQFCFRSSERASRKFKHKESITL